MADVKIIELFGLPGCGKSTFVKSILSILQKNCPNNIKSRSDILGGIKKLINRPFLLLIIFIYHFIKPGNYKTKIKLLRFSIFFPFNRYVVYYLLYIITLLDVYKQKRPGIVVLDQGLIQSLTSISHDIIIERTDLIDFMAKHLEGTDIDVLYVECRLDRASNIQRIKQRNRKDRFAYQDGLDKLLTVKETNLAIISNVLAKNKITLNMQDPYNLNAMKLIDKLYQD